MLFRSFVDNRWFAEHEPYVLHHLTLVQAGISSALFFMATKIDLLVESQFLVFQIHFPSFVLRHVYILSGLGLSDRAFFGSD